MYKFNLDNFQREAVNHIERDESVLVAAHTSAGKTAVAEYAIAKSFRDKQRVIYTSPIKALSNQKYRDLQEEFGDVGLMTGDMTINPSATCLIMTTEILRSMLYRGSEVVREVAWVIYDEVHYMRDKERGVVWEESIILLPHKVRFVFLSATIPNAPSFVSWISKIHHQPCHVVYTDYRPVPLQHYVFPASAEGLYLVVDEKGAFKESNFQKAMAILQPNTLETAEYTEKKSRKQVTKNLSADLMKIIQLIMAKQLQPCIIFSFSKKDCEAYALKMASFEFNSPEEKHLVEQVFNNAIEALSEDDKTLPQITTILPLLKRGVGIHHGGLLPILKEVIEILFQEGLLKCLFATETFSIGINMPAKTVVFTRTRKFDGKDFRWITSGEYIQMSGRAGRRGKDDKGIVIQMLDEKMEPDIAKNMIYGASDPLYSSYHISYNMVLNMMRVEGADPEKLIKCSFHQFQQELNAPGLLRKAAEIEEKARSMEVPDEEMVVQYNNLLSLQKELRNQYRSLIMEPTKVLPFLSTGRMVKVNFKDRDWGWAVVLGVKRAVEKKPIDSSFDVTKFIGKVSSRRQPLDGDHFVDILMEVVRKPATNATDTESHLAISPLILGERYEKSSKDILLVHASLDALCEVSAVKLNVPKDFKAASGTRNAVWGALQEVLRRFSPPKGDGVPLMDPVRDMEVPADQIQPVQERMKEISKRLEDSQYRHVSKEALAALTDKKALLEEAAQYKKEATELQSVTMKEELKKMRKVLKRMDYVSAEGVLSAKGRFACELTAGDELVLCNMVFGGMFNELTVEQTVAILSCLVHKEPNQDSSSGSTPRIRPDMQKPFRQLQAVAKEVAKVCVEVRLFAEEQEFVDGFVPTLVDVAYAWASGAKFSEVCKLTDVFEGSIIRSLRRLEELLRQLAVASQAIGNNELVALFSEGATKIRRGVVFAASLYI
ncbi:RNA helicase [archaeon]|nr:MAG: RNA helicase [archaeon]